MRDKITSVQSLKFENVSHPTNYWVRDYLSMLGLKLNYVNKRDPWPWYMVASLQFYRTWSSGIHTDRKPNSELLQITTYIVSFRHRHSTTQSYHNKKLHYYETITYTLEAFTYWTHQGDVNTSFRHPIICPKSVIVKSPTVTRPKIYKSSLEISITLLAHNCLCRVCPRGSCHDNAILDSWST